MPAIEIDRPILSHKSFNNIGLQLGLCLILTGCTPTPPAVAPTTAPVTVASKDKTETTSKLASTPDVTQAEKPKTTGQVELQVVDLKGYETILARHAGQVVLVDFWATWCAPCRKQFPHSVQLHRKLQDRGLAVISVSIDQLEEGESLDELRTKVLDFLTSQEATFANLLVPVTDLAAGDPGATDLLAERFDLDGGAIPHYKLYDRKGNLHRKFTVNLETGESFDQQDLDAAVEKLLAE